MNNQEIKQKLEDIILSCNDGHSDGWQTTYDFKTCLKFMIESFNLGVTLSAENVKGKGFQTINSKIVTLKEDDGIIFHSENSLTPELEWLIDKDSILKLLIE